MSTIRFSTFPRTAPPPSFVAMLAALFEKHENTIGTLALAKGLTSNQVLAELRDDLVTAGFEVEAGKGNDEKIRRPVFFGENAAPTLQYEIDAYHPKWECGLEVEAGRALAGNAIYRDLIQACVMVQVKYLVLAVPNAYTYRGGINRDYESAVKIAEALYGHSRLRLPYDLVVIGY